ncbi:MAG: type II toxin-antitoxin system Phd/YefM family antitoxin [Janthinobacterium lividum]
MAAYNIYEAKTNLSSLVEKAMSGEEVLIAKAGKPLLRLVPLAEQDTAFHRPAPGFAKGEFTDLIQELEKPWPEDLLRAFEMAE